MRLLLVEPYPPLARALRRTLEEEGFEVQTTTAIPDTAGSYDAIILDLDPPACRGLEVLGELRRGGLTTPALVLTVPGPPPNGSSPPLGVHATLGKPFRQEDLLARLRALLGASGGA